MEPKFCQSCGNKVTSGAVICTQCGRQLADLKTNTTNQTPQVIINNTNTNTNTVNNPNKKCNKWVSFFLCLFLGLFGAHKFYEGKTGIGILYLFTAGLFGFGVLIDLIALLFKPNPYYA